MLTLPFCMAQMGIVSGILSLCLAAAVSIISIEILMHKAVESGAIQYGELVGKKMKEFGTLFDGLLCVYGMGVQVVYLIFTGTFLEVLCKQFFPEATALHERRMWVWVQLAVVIPLSAPKKLTALRYCSILAAVTMAYTAVLIVCKFPESVKNRHFPQDYRFVSFNWNFFEAFGNFLFAYNCHLNVVPVASEMAMPTDS